MAHGVLQKKGLRQERSKFSTNKRRKDDYTSKRSVMPPFVRGQTITVTIEEIGHNGDGIAHQDGFTIFVPNSNIGEKVKAKVWRLTRTIVFTKRAESTRLSPGRGEQKRTSRLGKTKKDKL